MSTHNRNPSTSSHPPFNNPTTTNTHPFPPITQKTYFESQREMLIGEVAQSLEHVLQNLNKLNRALEEVIAVGNEFSPVEALWSHFEGVMAKRDGDEEKESGAEKSAGDDGEEGEGRGEE